MSLAGRVAVLTGGEGPLGRAVSRKLLEDGVKLVIGWYDPNLWDEAKGLIDDKFRDQFIDVQFDTTKASQVQGLMQQAKDTFGTIDILCHMVGMFYSGKTIWETDESTFESLVQVNLKGAFLVAKYAIPVMLEKNKGRMIFFPGRLPIQPPAGFGANGMSRAGMYTLTFALREELKKTGITVNSIMPSVIDTPHTRSMPFAHAEKGIKPEEIADIVSLICSDQGAALSGSVLRLLGQI